MRTLLPAILLLLVGVPYSDLSNPTTQAHEKRDSKSESPLGLCGCWTNKLIPYDGHYPHYVITDNTGYEDFACNVGACERVSETLSRLRYWREGSGAEQVIMAPVIRCLPLKNSLDIWNEKCARAQFTVESSETADSLERVSEGGRAAMMNAAVARGDKAAIERLEAEERVEQEKRLEKLKSDNEKMKKQIDEATNPATPK